MDDYLKIFREMVSLRGLTHHTIISYSTYIRAYLQYLSEVLKKRLRKFPSRNYAITLNGSNRNGVFQTAQSMR